MNVKSLISNMSVAFLAQGIAMAMSVVQTLLVPKVLGIEQYGYWQLFIFYISYVGLLTFGLNDGIYLVHGGKSRGEMPKVEITSQMFMGLAAYLAMAITVICLSLNSSMPPERKLVVVYAAIYMVLQNVASGMSVTFQAMNETKKASMMIIVERTAFLVPLVVFIISKQATFSYYIVAYLASNIVRLVYSIWNMKDFLEVPLAPVSVALSNCINSMRVGIKLTLANIASQMILGVARFVIDSQWGIETFGQVSFALSLVNFFLAFVNQASMVLFPFLRQSMEDELKSFYASARNVIATFAPVSYIVFFPMTVILEMWLPQYAHSLHFFIFLLPICIYESKMSVTCTTVFKVIRKEKILFIVNFATVTLSAVGSIIGGYLIQSVDFVVASMMFSIVFRSFISERYLDTLLECPKNDLLYWEGLCTLLFVASSLFLPANMALLITSAFYFSMLFRHFEMIKEMMLRVNRLIG